MADPKYVKDFIDQMTPYAIEVGDRYGIDPITIITQAAIETGWGTEVAGNNYFGVKSHGQPGGQNITTHEEINGKRVKVRDSFRKYGSLGESVADYGRFLSENPRYAEAIAKTGRDELAGIAGAGYATSSKYPNLMANVGRMVERNIRPIPPGEIPNVVGSLTDTIPPPVPTPVTSSPDLAQMRRTAAPSRLIQDSFAQLPQRRGSTLADSLALNPIQGGRQTPPPFDAAFDTRTGTMRMLAQPETTSSQGLGVGSSRAPVALPRPRPVAQQSASDRARGNTPMNLLTVGGRSPIGLVEPGNLDLNRRIVMNDGSGGFRTENSISIGTDRGEVLIPTVVNGRQISEQEAIDHYRRTGENLGTFQTPQAADRYAESLHERQGQRYVGSAPKAVPQSQIDRIPARSLPELPRPRPQTAASDLISTSMHRIASSNPTRLPPVPPSTMGRTPQSQIDRSPSRSTPVAPVSRPRVTVSTPYTTPQSTIDRGAPRTVAPSPVGQPPATRVVRSVPMPPIRPQSPAAATVSASDRARAARNTPSGIEDRLPSTPMAGRFASPPTVVFDPAFSTAEVTGTVGQTVRPNGPLAPLPRPPIDRAVATALDVTPMPELPRPRPDLGMGGVDIPAALAQTGQVAPTPMPRLKRPGLFGTPQILGYDIKLPGVLGVIQGATAAMNNASGPFNNGADNSLYNALRGGDFNAPGAATAQSGGYLYAPRPGGGYINVGRANPAMSGAALYDSLNRRNEFNDDAANRVNGRGGSNGGGSRSAMS